MGSDPSRTGGSKYKQASVIVPWGKFPSPIMKHFHIQKQPHEAHQVGTMAPFYRWRNKGARDSETPKSYRVWIKPRPQLRFSRSSEFPHYPWCCPFHLACQQAKGKSGSTQPEEQWFSYFSSPPPPNDVLGRTTIFRIGESRAAPVGVGVRVEGQIPEPRPSSCSFLPSLHPTPPMVLTPSTML